MISYGLYLWHWPIYVFLTQERTGLEGTSLLFVRLLVTFAVATASYFLVELPVRHGALRGRTVRAAIPAFAALLAIAVVASTARPVPETFQSVSASQLKAPTPAPAPIVVAKTATTKVRKAPLRVMLVGDSVANSLAPGLAATAKARGYQFWNASVPGCGLGTDVGDRWFDEWRGVYPPCLPGWRDRWPHELKVFRPDIVVGLFGAQDAFDRRMNGHIVHFDTPDGTALATHDLQSATTMLSSRGAHVVLLTTPYYVMGWPQKVQIERSPLNAPWIDRYNLLQTGRGPPQRRSRLGRRPQPLSRSRRPLDRHGCRHQGAHVRPLPPLTGGRRVRREVADAETPEAPLDRGTPALNQSRALAAAATTATPPAPRHREVHVVGFPELLAVDLLDAMPTGAHEIAPRHDLHVRHFAWRAARISC